jgi:ribosomal protein S6E (S10)
MQPIVFSPSADVFVVRPFSTAARQRHRLHVQFRPPDDGPVRPETCRGNRIADTVCRRKRIVYRDGNKENKLY